MYIVYIREMYCFSLLYAVIESFKVKVDDTKDGHKV